MSLREETKSASQDAAQTLKRTVFAFSLSWRGKKWEIVMSTFDRVPFRDALLSNARPPWRSFGLGALLQTVFLVAVLSVPLLFPDRVRDFRNYMATVIAPSPEVVSAWKPEPLRSRRVHSTIAQPNVALPATPSAVRAVVASTPVIEPVRATTKADPPNISNDGLALLPLNTPVVPQLKEPRQGVQVGAFGGPTGASDGSPSSQGRDVAHLGGFGPPLGAVARREGIAAPQGPGQASIVRQGLFPREDAVRVVPRLRKSDETSTQTKPVEILYKPKPIYTSAALSKRVEGEVLLEVQFSASGQPVVLRVVRGLGYGLDEAAEVAASQIKFRPAQDDQGHAVDSTAIVHVVFGLAY